MPARGSYATSATLRLLAVFGLAALAAATAPLAARAQTDAATGHAAVAAKASADPEQDAVFGAVVKVNTKAFAGARSLQSLGAEREGSGVAISVDGLVLTIGYLIVEAEQVTITDHKGRSRPARVVGYDHATGLGLVKSLAPLELPVLPLGDSSSLAERQPVMVVSHLGRDAAHLAYVVSRRAFTGNWEYMLDRAIFIAPATRDWSGAALVGKDGSLLGVGSLFVREAAPGLEVPGNVFVPVELLKPILDDLVRLGRRSGPARPWLGMAADEVHGRLFVTRVSDGGPADQAGVRAGDILIAVKGEAVTTQAAFYRRLWSLGKAGTDIVLRVLQGTELRDLTVHSIDRVEYFKPRPTL